MPVCSPIGDPCHQCDIGSQYMYWLVKPVHHTIMFSNAGLNRPTLLTPPLAKLQQHHIIHLFCLFVVVVVAAAAVVVAVAEKIFYH